MSEEIKTENTNIDEISRTKIPTNRRPKVVEAPSLAPDGRSLERVINYDNYRKGGVVNHIVEGFWFDQNQFENLIDAWADQDDILTILGVSRQELDIFCKALYGLSFDATYRQLLAISRTLMRKAIGGLAKSGNATALATATKHYANLHNDDNNKPINITIKNDLD